MRILWKFGGLVMVKWEYCLEYKKEVTYYTMNGERVQGFKSDSAAACELGENGWELVAVQPLGTMYFKRPKVT